MAAIKLFGFTLGNKDIVQKEKPEQASFALPTEAHDDGAVTITQNAHYGTYVDLEGAVRNELELITRYREMANHPECDQAVTEIVDEAITHDDDGTVVDIKLDNENKTLRDIFRFNLLLSKDELSRDRDRLIVETNEYWKIDAYLDRSIITSRFRNGEVIAIFEVSIFEEVELDKSEIREVLLNEII